MKREMTFPTSMALLVALAVLPGGCGDDEPDRRPTRAQPTDDRKEVPQAAVQEEPPVGEAMYGGEGDRRIGNTGLPLVPVSHAEVYPQREQWKQAGVSFGIKPDRSVQADVPAGGDIQAAIDRVESGMLVLAAGEYRLTAPLEMKANVTLRGAPEGTTLVYGEQGGARAVRFQGLEGAGLENLTLRYADPDRLADRPHYQPGRYANAEGFRPGGTAAVEMVEASDCWLSDVRIVRPLEMPLRVRDSKHCTFRGVEVDGTLNRGPGAGAVEISGRYHLLAGLRVQGARMIRFAGPAEWCVLRSSVLGCGVYLEEADRVRGLLVEDCHFLFRPGYPLPPIAKGHMPAGEDSRVANCTTIYHHGTDAVNGQLMEPRKVYEIAPYADRVKLSLEDGSLERTRLVRRHKVTRVLGEEPAGARGATDLAATWTDAPEGVPVMSIRSKALVGDWVWTESVGAGVLELPVGPLVEDPLRPGEVRQIGGAEVEVSRVPEAERRSAPSRAAHIQQMVGRFGRRAIPPAGSEVSLLAQAGGDWEGGLVLQRVVHVPGRPVLSYNAKVIGTRIRVFIGETELAEKRLYRLAPGYHPVTVLAQLDKAMPLVTKATLGLRFELQPAPEATTVRRDAPEPEGGFLYPYRPAADPIAAERDALAAWDDYFAALREFPFPDRAERTRTLIEAHSGTHVAWVAERILSVLENAPHDEDAELTPRQWGRLADYYKRSGMPERAWAIGRKRKFPTYREYYPGMEVK